MVYKSGSQKRKLLASAEKKNTAVLDKCPKIKTFFQSSAPTTLRTEAEKPTIISQDPVPSPKEAAKRGMFSADVVNR